VLAATEGFASAVLEALSADELASVADELEAVNEMVNANVDFRDVLTDTSITNVARGTIVRELLADKVRASTSRLVSYAAGHAHAQNVPGEIAELATRFRHRREGSPDVLGALSLLDARRRVAGFADAVLEDQPTETYSAIEDDLFRWARYVESNAPLRRFLVDRDPPLAARQDLTRQLLADKVSTTTLQLALFVLEGGRPRDVVGTLDFLVDYVATARSWRVARVFSARQLDAGSKQQIITSLQSISGANVEIEEAQDPSLLGGVLVEMGDLRLDATTQGRLSALRDAVSPGYHYESSFD